MDVIQLIEAQFEIERIGFDEQGLLVRAPGPSPDDLARVYVFQHRGGHTLYFRHDVPPGIRQRISDLGPGKVFRNQEIVKALLAYHGPCDDVFRRQTYLFPGTIGPSQFPDAVCLTEAHRPLIEQYHPGMNVTERVAYAVIRDEMIVSTCLSIRENERAGEAYTYTVPKYRRQGYGRQVTAAWGHHLKRQGKIAFYGHALENVASRCIAQSLRLKPCYISVVYS